MVSRLGQRRETGVFSERQGKRQGRRGRKGDVEQER